MKREKVLLVEDDIDLLNLMDFHLTGRGYLTAGSLDGLDAVKKIADFKPDLIILDLMLPGMDGWEICRHIRRQRIACQILMLTAKAMPEDRADGLRIGADDYVTKPFDVRELMIRIERLLEKKREKAVLHDYISIISHEVTNEMLAVAGLSEVLQDDMVDDSRKKSFLKYINAAALGATGLLSEIRTLIDVERRDFILRHENVDIIGIIDDATRPHTDIGFDIAADGIVPELNSDPVAVKLVFANIIGNAVKYGGGKGNILIRIKQEGNFLAISIKDNGCGIPEEDLPRIFEKGYRAKNALREFKGTGMGLYIAKLLMDKMGGQIEAKSEERKGSEFTVRFPVL